MQIFLYKDRGFSRELAERAAPPDYDALVLTIDNQLLGNRERDIRNGFSIPPRFGVGGTLAAATKLAWLMRMRTTLPNLTFGNYVRPGETTKIAALAGRMGEILDPGLSWADVDWLRGIWNGPLILKGILHPAEAAEAVARGVDGIIVSNHGGRQLDGAAASLDALPAIVAAVDGRIPVLLDGGIRRGGDVVKALALGATCCLIARPQLWGLAVGGEAGVRHVLELFRREIDRVMGLMGALDRRRPRTRLPPETGHETMIKDPPLLTIKRGKARPPAALVEAFRDVPTGYLTDAMGGRGCLLPVDPAALAGEIVAGRRRHHLPLRPGGQSRGLRRARRSRARRRHRGRHRRYTHDLGHRRSPARHGAQQGRRGLRHRRHGARHSGHRRRRPAGLLRRRDAELAGAQRPGHGRLSAGHRRCRRRHRRHHRRRPRWRRGGAAGRRRGGAGKTAGIKAAERDLEDKVRAGLQVPDFIRAVLESDRTVYVD